MKDFPLVSIVTPCFNAAQYITETIESVRQQDYPDIEHIIVDGASSDGTVEILKEYVEVNWISEPDGGQSEAINKGFRRAKGAIIGWLNADDTYQVGTISTVVNFFQDHPEIDLVYSDVRVVDENGQLIGVSKSRPFDPWLLLQVSFIKQPTVFMRRSVIEKIKEVDENLHYVMDREFWLRIGLSGFKMHYLSGEALANFRKCQGTKSFNSSLEFGTEWLQVLKRVMNDSYFDNIDNSVKQHVLKKQQVQQYFSRSIQAVNEKNIYLMAVHLKEAFKVDSNVVFDKNFWFIIGMGLAKKPVDWHRKFEKSG